MLRFILARLAERTTWLGLTALAASSGVVIVPEMVTAITSAGVGVAGLIGMITER